MPVDTQSPQVGSALDLRPVAGDVVTGALTMRWLMPRRGASGDASGQAVWTGQPQARPAAWSRLTRPHGAAPEPPSRRALSWHQPSDMEQSVKGVRLGLVGLLSAWSSGASGAATVGQTDIRRSGRHDG